MVEKEIRDWVSFLSSRPFLLVLGLMDRPIWRLVVVGPFPKLLHFDFFFFTYSTFIIVGFVGLVEFSILKCSFDITLLL